ncbi:MAG: T9SS C-terminal target domain-containing protein [Calditrichaeota bacterium]|nr:MAG: T9SS C-terminal target domain-containing protein [Calditrichota bacterium]
MHGTATLRQLRQRALLSMLLWVFLMFGIQAQDDPRYDNVVGLTPPPTTSPRPVEVITSPEGFDNFDLGVDFAEPHMSVNPQAPTEFFNAWNTNSAHYTYDGHDWFTITPPFPGFSTRGDPVTAHDSLGNLYYMNMYGSGGIQGAVVIRSTDNGATWSAPAVAVAGVDKCWIAADQTAGPFANYVYATMTAGGGRGNFARSTDFGQTWQTTFSPFTQSLPGMMVAVGPNVLGGNNISGGCVYVVTNSGAAQASVYTFYRSTDGGATFQLMSSQSFAGYVGTFVNGRHSVENSRTRPYPFIAADNSFGPFRGRLYLVYATNDPPGNGNKPDIFLRYSDDQGATWSSAIRVNDDPNPQANHQWTPAVWVDKWTGRVYVKWYDTRRTPTSDSTDVYASYSDDGGVTWAPNQRLTTEKFRIDCTSCGGGGTPRYQGDYDAITSNGVVSMAVWTDFRNGNFGSFVAYFPDFALLISAPRDTLSPVNDSLDVVVKVPAVKLYNHPVYFSATSNPPANFTFSWPEGDSLTSYPDSVTLRIAANGVPIGEYQITVSGVGPNGTPVHRRTLDLTVLGPFVEVTQPNGGEQAFARARFPIRWTFFQVDRVNLEYSLDGGATWNLIAEDTTGVPGLQHPKLRWKPDVLEGGRIEELTFFWEVPDTLSDSCLVRITATNDTSLVDVSDSLFAIVTPPAAQWQANSVATNRSFFSVSVVDTAVAWAVGASGAIYRTTNGGRTWQQRTPIPTDIFHVHGVNADTAFLSARFVGRSRIYRTINGGQIWQTVYADTSSAAFINAVKMFDKLNGYAVGDPVNGQWTLLRTSDGGQTWAPADTLPQEGNEVGWNNSMWWINDQFGWFGTSNGRVYFTTDGGASWNFGATTFGNSYSVSFADSLSGIAAGDGLDYSADGGATWMSAPGQLAPPIFGSAAINITPRRWYAVSGSQVYKTTDDAASWQVDYSQANNYLALDMKPVELEGNLWICGYAVGEQGTISRYLELVLPTGVAQNNPPAARVFALEQNYPNPFNPVTHLRFRISESGFAELKVYDLLGREVTTLLGKRISPGSYEVQWDGTDDAGRPVSSGVYFYRLVIKDGGKVRFRQVRKMILMR